MKSSYLLNRGILAIVAALLVFGAHGYLNRGLPRVESAFESWLNSFEEKLLKGEAPEVRIIVTLKTKNVERRWLLEEPSSTRAEKNLLLRVLQLLREGGLVENSTDQNEYVSVEIESAQFRSKSRVAWTSLTSNLPAKNMFVLLESIRPTTITPIANGRHGSREG